MVRRILGFDSRLRLTAAASATQVASGAVSGFVHHARFGEPAGVGYQQREMLVRPCGKGRPARPRVRRPAQVGAHLKASPLVLC
jgi:hypothetical protein